MPDRIARLVLRRAEPLHADESVGAAIRKVLDADLPELPAVEPDGTCAGLFGAHEFLAAFFPAYLDFLRTTRMISQTVDDALQRRTACIDEPIRAYLNTDHMVVDDGFSDTQLAEIFLHHRVSVIPVATGGTIRHVVPLDDFFRALGERALSAGSRRPTRTRIRPTERAGRRPAAT